MSTGGELERTRRELAGLRRAWGGAYIILAAGRTFSAARRDGRGTVTRLTAVALAAALVEDQLARPVSPLVPLPR